MSTSPAPICPKCREPLADHRVSGIFHCWECDSCGGQAFLRANLATLIDPVYVDRVYELGRASKRIGQRACPNCGRAMVIVNGKGPCASYELDVCNGCAVIWFDSGELDESPRKPEELPRAFGDDGGQVGKNAAAYWLVAALLAICSVAFGKIFGFDFLKSPKESSNNALYRELNKYLRTR